MGDFSVYVNNFNTNSNFLKFVLIYMLLFFIVILVNLVGMIKIYKKLNKPGWAVIVPIYNMWALFEGVGLPGWLSILPVANLIGLIVAYFRLARVLNKSAGFGLGLVFLSFIFIPILGFSDAKMSTNDDNNSVEGFDLMAKKSKDFNKGYSELTSSIKIIQSSAALIVGSFLPVANSILKPIASIIAIISNFVSRISASLQGQTKYLKVNLEYFKDYKSQMQGSLLAFDTFTTLNATPNDIFQEENIENGKGFLETISSIREEFEKLPAIIQDLIIGLTILGSIKLVKWIMDGSLKKALSKTFTTSNLGIAILTAGILLLVEGIKQLVDNWNNVNFSGWEKAVTIVTSLVAGIVAAVVAIKAFHMPVTAALGIGAGLVGGILLLGTQLAQLTAFADGGMFEGAGTMYALAGESGAEIVAKGSQGTGVTNIAQFRQAMVEALYEYGASRGNLDNIKIQMNNTQVGKMVARSSYDEMKRQGLL